MAKRKWLRGIIIVLAIVCVVVIAVSGYMLFNIQKNYNAAEMEYDELRTLVSASVSTVSGAEGVPASDTSSAVALQAENSASIPNDIGSSEIQTNTIAPTAQKPNRLIQLNFEPLRAKNEDVVGWIFCKDSLIDYPVVQGEDNSTYLNHSFSKRRSTSGSIFIDKDNAPDFSDQNTVIYGHRLNNGAMFSDLAKYREQSYFDKHPIMFLFTPAGDYKVELFSAYNRDASAVPHSFVNEKERSEYITQIRSESDIQSEVNVGPNDRIITMVTCAYVFDNARYVVYGKLVPLYE